jgi:twitching motility protein PilT
MAGLGDILVEQGVLTPMQLEQAETHRQASGGNLTKALVELRLANEEDLVRAFATTLGMPYAAVDGGSVDPNAAALLPADIARELTALPVRFGDANDVIVAIADPGAREDMPAKLTAAMGLPVTVALAPRRALLEAIEVFAREQEALGLVEPARPPLHAVASAQQAPATPAPPPFADAPNGNGTNGTATNGHGPDLAPDLPPEPAHDVLNHESQREFAPSRKTELTHAEPTVMSEEVATLDLDALLKTLVGRGGSDLHLTTGIPPAIRVNGELTHLDEFAVLEADELQKLLYAIMTQKQREEFENHLELDMSYSIPGLARFRVNIFQQRDALGSVMRVIPFEILPLENLGIPDQVSNFAYLPRGFVLVTGPTGSGKSTTLASLIDLANRNRAAHIMTVEDPIEFLHDHKKSVVNQREVGTDTHGFAPALKHVLRQDPDIILVGEMRDLETIQIALTAAETGHLVFGTLHTQDAPQSIDRIIDVFPPHQQEQIRVMLAGALKGVVCQTLVKTADGKGRTAAVEIMVVNSGIKNLIREGKTHQIYSAIQAGAKDGMIAMDQSLAIAVKAGKITYDAALEKCNNVNEFNRLAGRA